MTMMLGASTLIALRIRNFSLDDSTSLSLCFPYLYLYSLFDDMFFKDMGGMSFNTQSPSSAPSRSKSPTVAPSTSARPSVSAQPSGRPSTSSSPSQSHIPTGSPSSFPSGLPSVQPSPVPSVAPQEKQSLRPSFAPTLPPSASHQPSNSYIPSHVPTKSLQPSAVPPSSTPSSRPSGEPTSVPSTARPPAVFVCNGFVEEAEPPFSATSVLDFQVGYLVETLAPFSSYQEDLEKQILEAALAGALSCNLGGPLFGEEGTPPNIPVTTVITNQDCTPQVPGSNCTVLSTGFSVTVGEEVDSTVTELLGYVTLQEEMDQGGFVEDVVVLDRVEYLSPLPFLPPPVQEPEEPTVPPQSQLEPGPVSVSPWTVGAVVAMCLGGLLAMWVWARNRRTRHQRHMQLMEDASFAAASGGTTSA